MAFEEVSAESSELDHGRDGQAVLGVVRVIVERIFAIIAVPRSLLLVELPMAQASQLLKSSSVLWPRGPFGSSACFMTFEVRSSLQPSPDSPLPFPKDHRGSPPQP